MRAGQVRALGVDSAERSPVLPDVRAIREAGFPEFGMSNWIGVFAPPGMSDELTMQVRNAFVDALQTGEIQNYLKNDGLTSAGTTPQDFRQEIVREFDKMGALIRPLNLKP